MATKIHIRYISDRISIDEGEEEQEDEKWRRMDNNLIKCKEVSGRPISFSPFLACSKYQIEVKLLATIFPTYQQTLLLPKNAKQNYINVLLCAKM